jgi:ubiquinone/menaquinone biosynthesis C-methylase UbiE
VKSSPDNRSELIKYYHHRAPEYEQIYYRDVPQRQAELAAEKTRLIALVRDREVLDLACGTGYWLEGMAAVAKSIVATDINRAMLSEARTKSCDGTIDFVQADLNHPPATAGSFDIVSLGFWFSHHPRQDYDAFFDTILTPLKPDGRIWMIDNNPPAEGATREPVGADEHGNNFTRRYLDNGEAYVILKNYFSENDLQGLFSSRFQVERLTFGECYWSVELARK